MSEWFNNTIDINCNIQRVKDSLDNIGTHYLEVIRLMPGITSVELVDQGSDFVILKTNEGMMKRTNINKSFEVGRVSVEFDEEYEVGRMITATSHILDEFTVNGDIVKFNNVISNVEVPGLLGFFYRKFGKSNIGNAFLMSNKVYFEQ